MIRQFFLWIVILAIKINVLDTSLRRRLRAELKEEKRQFFRLLASKDT